MILYVFGLIKKALVWTVVLVFLCLCVLMFCLISYAQDLL